MKLSMFEPLKSGIFPFPPIDGSPQTLEGGLAEPARDKEGGPFMSQTVLLTDGDMDSPR
jgi:hypothetical protein